MADIKLIPAVKTSLKSNRRNIIRYTITILMAFVIGAIVIWYMGYEPLSIYFELFFGAFGSKLYIGTTLERFTSTLLLGLAFNICAKVRFFNLGLEGCLYAGALAYAVVGYQFPNLSGIIYLPLCILACMIVGALWSGIPALFRVKYNTNEVCTTIMLNYVAIQLTTYAIYYVWAARTAIPQTPELVPQVKLPQILLPSRLSIGLFVSLGVYLLVTFLYYRTSLGFMIRTVGQNPFFAQYVGINAKRVTFITVLVGGAIAGLAGGLQVSGSYGRFLEAFAVGSTFDGLLSSRLAKNNLKAMPFAAFGIAILKTGAYGVERMTGVPRAFIDLIIALLILFVVTDNVFDFPTFRKWFGKRKKRQNAKQPAA